MKKQNKLLGILLIILSFCVLVSCEDKPDVYLCVYLKEDLQDGSVRYFSHCVNPKTKAEIEVESDQMKNWITTSPDNYEKLRDWYKEKCKM